jgi:hypothetical protein
MRNSSVRRLTLQLVTAVAMVLVLRPGFDGAAKTVPPLGVPQPDLPAAAMLYVLKDPEGLDSSAASALLLSSHTELGRKLSEERVRSRLHGGNTCRDGEKCEEVVILRREASNYRIRIFCSVHPDDQSFPSVEIDAAAMKIARVVSRHDNFHK